MRLFKNSYKNKMRALLEGLEIQYIDKFMAQGKTDDYRNLGKQYTEAVKRKIKNNLTK